MDDDLFLRVSQLMAGLIFVALGVGSVVAARQPLAFGIQVTFGLIAVVLLFLGGGLIALGLAPSDSRLRDLARKFWPDAAGLEDATFLVIAVYVPAALITLALRLLGVGNKS